MLRRRGTEGTAHIAGPNVKPKTRRFSIFLARLLIGSGAKRNSLPNVIVPSPSHSPQLKLRTLKSQVSSVGAFSSVRLDLCWTELIRLLRAVRLNSARRALPFASELDSPRVSISLLSFTSLFPFFIIFFP